MFKGTAMPENDYVTGIEALVLRKACTLNRQTEIYCEESLQNLT